MVLLAARAESSVAGSEPAASRGSRAMATIVGGMITRASMTQPMTSGPRFDNVALSGAP